LPGEEHRYVEQEKKNFLISKIFLISKNLISVLQMTGNGKSV